MAGDLASNRNEIFAMVSAAWAELPSVFPRFPPQAALIFTMTDNDGVPTGIKQQAWARLQMQHTAGESRAISQRRYTNRGILTLQCFVFRKVSNDDDLVQRVASFIAGKFKQHRGSVLLTAVAAIERPINNGFAQCDVIAQFEWDQFNRQEA